MTFSVAFGETVSPVGVVKSSFGSELTLPMRPFTSMCSKVRDRISCMSSCSDSALALIVTPGKIESLLSETIYILRVSIRMKERMNEWNPRWLLTNVNVNFFTRTYASLTGQGLTLHPPNYLIGSFTHLELIQTSSEWKLFIFDRRDISAFEIVLIDVTF